MWTLLAAVLLATKGNGPLHVKLEKVEKGLSAIAKTSPAIEDLVAPMIAEVHQALETHKEDKMATALKEFPKWQAQLSARSEEVAKADDQQRNSLLVAVLQNKASETEATQLGVVNAHDFSGLPVVAYINEHRDGKEPLVSLAIEFFSKPEAPPPAKEEVKGLDSIVKLLEASAAKSKAKVEIIDEHIEKVKGVFEKMEAKHKPSQPLKFLEKKQLREIRKQRAFELSTEKALEKAVTDIEHHDVKGVKEAQEALKQSMQAMEQAQGNFLKLLQIQGPASFACPYCGAQCLEKCNHDEPSKGMGGCLQECLAKNPKPPSAK